MDMKVMELRLDLESNDSKRGGGGNLLNIFII